MPMPVHGARATGGAFQTAAIRRTSNAGPPFSVWADFADRIHSPERPTGRAPEDGVPPARRGATGAEYSRGHRDIRGELMSNGQALPILIAGGGIGGLAAAHALARKGFAVRVLEQAPEFREIGAGIQLGPNIFRALERLGLKEAVLADAHRPPAMEMRCALSGERVTRIPLD